MAKKPAKKITDKKIKKSPVKKIKAKKPVKKIVSKKPKTVKKAKIPKKIVKKPQIKKTPIKKTSIKKSEKKPVKIAPPQIVKKVEPAKVVEKVKDQPYKPNTIKIPEKKISEKNVQFKAGDHAFYPSHGVGKILEIEKTTIAGQKFELLIMFFEKEKLTIKIPSNQIAKTGLRPLISMKEMEEVFDILRSGVKKLKGMWSRRAQEYESKINSGNITLLAEVLRDLTRDIEDGDRSYSERIIYETAINRLALEYSIIAKISFEEAKEKVISTAKNKLGISEEVKIESKIKTDDDFDEDFEDEDEEGEEDEEDDDYEDDEDDERPKKRGKKK